MGLLAGPGRQNKEISRWSFAGGFYVHELPVFRGNGKPCRSRSAPRRPFFGRTCTESKRRTARGSWRTGNFGTSPSDTPDSRESVCALPDEPIDKWWWLIVRQGWSRLEYSLYVCPIESVDTLVTFIMHLLQTSRWFRRRSTAPIALSARSNPTARRRRNHLWSLQKLHDKGDEGVHTLDGTEYRFSLPLKRSAAVSNRFQSLAFSDWANVWNIRAPVWDTFIAKRDVCVYVSFAGFDPWTFKLDVGV